MRLQCCGTGVTKQHRKETGATAAVWPGCTECITESFFIIRQKNLMKLVQYHVEVYVVPAALYAGVRD